MEKLCDVQKVMPEFVLKTNQFIFGWRRKSLCVYVMVTIMCRLNKLISL